MKVYHFRDSTYGLQSLQKKRLKVARIMKLNDPFEFLGVSLSDRNTRKGFSEMKKKMSEHTGLLCFSKNWKSPVQWTHYADNHTGICMEFEVPKKYVKRVHYVKNRLKPPKKYSQQFMEKVLCTKFDHWSYEEEYREFLKLKDLVKEGNFFFYEFSEYLKLTKVIVGSRSLITRNELSKALGDTETDTVAFKSRLAFQTFNVVKNNNASLWA